MSRSDKLRILAAAIRVLPSFNPNRALQLSLYKADVVSLLDSYARRLRAGTILLNQTNLEFHKDMVDIFQQLNDRHTVYALPPPLFLTFAFLPFVVRELFPFHTNTLLHRPSPKPSPAYVIHSGHSATFPDHILPNGSIILSWDGVGIQTHIRRAGRQGYGSNQAAKTSNAVRALTLLHLMTDLLPQKSDVDVTMRTPSGDVRFVRAKWFFVEFQNVSVSEQTEDNNMVSSRSHVSPFALHQLLVRSERIEHSRKIPSIYRTLSSQGLQRTEIPVREAFALLFSASIVRTASAGPVGHLVLPAFTVPSDAAADISIIAEELRHVLKLMPQNGLVVDLRNNAGGSAAYVKAVVELLPGADVSAMPQVHRSSRILEQTFQQHNTNLSDIERRILNAINSTYPSRTARRAGEQLTGPIGDLFSSDLPSNLGAKKQQRAYFGPLITVVDELTYSAGDVFAVVQKDQGISLLVGTSENTGAGGASFVPYSALNRLAPNIHKRLPDGVEFTTALFRFFRLGKRSGSIVEYFGVRPNVRYYPTFNDAIYDDCDFFEFLGERMKKLRK